MQNFLQVIDFNFILIFPFYDFMRFFFQLKLDFILNFLGKLYGRSTVGTGFRFFVVDNLSV